TGEPMEDRTKNLVPADRTLETLAQPHAIQRPLGQESRMGVVRPVALLQQPKPLLLRRQPEAFDGALFLDHAPTLRRSTLRKRLRLVLSRRCLRLSSSRCSSWLSTSISRRLASGRATMPPSNRSNRACQRSMVA